MCRNHARRLDAREPQHFDPNWYTFRQVFTLGDGGTKVRVISGAFAPSQWAGMTRIARVGRCLHPTAHQVRTTPLTAGRTDLGETGEHEVNGRSIRLQSCHHLLSYDGSTNPAHLYHLNERTA